MIKRLSHFFPLAVAAFLAASTYWLQFVVNNEQTSGLRSDPRAPDAIVEKLELDHFNVDGKHQFHLVADTMQHYAENDTATFTEPRLIFNRDQRVMHLSAKSGHGSNMTREVTLNGNVVATRQITNDPKIQVLKAETMLVRVDDEIVTAEGPVTMTQGATKIDGTGAEWDNVQGTLRMHQVDATLESPTHAGKR
ncbi:LPS export ABC transporter periplasmic protein LptC [Uliginosibacterium gangwonense]|uniref:LPS export ABC transporter periplasmic protein LptC n=1 Tax=Uliginosibacterium gangwonense TaxID=392736 RepID=UPI000379EF98|nr:LPS export ABC transporter periplasmic protein LptC [Uliginosibacterium gangwonense]